MADIISLFKTASEPSDVQVITNTLDATALAFSSISEIRSLTLPVVESGAARGDDQPVLRLLFAVGRILVGSEGGDEEAKKEGWASQQLKRQKGADILDLLWELWEVDRTTRLKVKDAS